MYKLLKLNKTKNFYEHNVPKIVEIPAQLVTKQPKHNKIYSFSTVLPAYNRRSTNASI